MDDYAESDTTTNIATNLFKSLRGVRVDPGIIAPGPRTQRHPVDRRRYLTKPPPSKSGQQTVQAIGTKRSAVITHPWFTSKRIVHSKKATPTHWQQGGEFGLNREGEGRVEHHSPTS